MFININTLRVVGGTITYLNTQINPNFIESMTEGVQHPIISYTYVTEIVMRSGQQIYVGESIFEIGRLLIPFDRDRKLGEILGNTDEFH